MDTVFIVGDKFRAFAGNDGVMTLGELEAQLNARGPRALPSGVRLVPGQGVRETDMQRVRHATRSHEHRVDVESRAVRAGCLSTHKHRLCNTIISSPVRLGEDVYESLLLVDERSELMGDHQTGQHIQGMVLVEAARQMFLAVTEDYFIGHEDPLRRYFVIQGLNVEFEAFVFPVDATLRYRIIDKRLDNPARLAFRVKIEVMQAGRCAARIGYEFTAFHAERIEAKESEQAANVLENVREARKGSRAALLRMQAQPAVEDQRACVQS